MNKKGAALVLIGAMIAIFTVMIVYFATTKPFYSLNDAFNTSMTSQGNTRAVESLGRLDNVWRYFPIIMIVGILFWLFLRLLKRQEQAYEYYQ